MLDIDFYRYLTRHIVPGPQDVSYFLPLLLLPISLSFPRSVLSRWQNIAVFMPLITLCSIRAWVAMNGLDVISVNTVLWSTLLIVLKDPWQDFRFMRPASDNAEAKDLSSVTSKTASNAMVEQSYPRNFGKRLIWIGRLLPAIRLDNWKISRASHDRRQPPAAGFPDARSFVIFSLFSLVRGFLILDLTRAYIEHDAYYFDTSISITSSLPFNTLRYVPPQLFRTMITGAQAYAAIGEMFYLPAAMPVMLYSIGLLPARYSPHTWPAYFGSPGAIFEFGVRGFWGSFWHQTMRWTTTGPGYAVADALDLRQGGLIRYAILSFSAFFFSGVVHSGLVPPEPRYTRESVNMVRLSMAGFFWSQFIAVVLEAAVGKLVVHFTGGWKRGWRRTVRLVVNGVWTVCWFSLSLPLLMDAARQLGYFDPWPLPISLWRWFTGHGLQTW